MYMYNKIKTVSMHVSVNFYVHICDRPTNMPEGN